MTCVSCMNRIAHQTTFFLFPILIIPVLDMESPQRDPRPPPYPPPPVRSWLNTWRDRLPSPDIAPGCPTDIPRIAMSASSYPIMASPIPAGPDTEQGCAYGKALSGRTLHHIRPDYEPHSMTVLCHIDMCRITPSMPYHYLQSEKSKR